MWCSEVLSVGCGVVWFVVVVCGAVVWWDGV